MDYFNGYGPEIRLPPKWIELNLTKRECSQFIQEANQELICQCGKAKSEHDEAAISHPNNTFRGETWTPSRHTVASPTDAYGQIIFEGEHHPNKARFVRLSYDTSPELVIQLMTFVWGLEMPKLVITVRGGRENFELPPRLGKILQVGLLKAAKSTNAWIFTNGINRGVTKHIGTALGNERWLGFKRGRVVSVGIAPWGIIDYRQDLIGRNRDRIYCALEHVGSKFRLLNPRHSNLLLVDNGSVGDSSVDYNFRKRLEKTLATYPMSPHRGCDTPIVCVVIEGGSRTLITVAEYLTEEPPIPVVIFGHTGRTADLLTYIMRKCDNIKELEHIKEEILTLMIRMYTVNASQSLTLFNELRKIYMHKHLLTIYIPHQVEDEGFDTVLLASIFRSQHWTPLQQLSLTLAWDRVDIATNEVFVYGRDWSRDQLEHAMMEALVSDRLDFVNLLLEHGLNMQTFLTPARLEGLYSLERTHSLQMRALLFELAKIRASQQKFPSNSKQLHDRNLTLHDVGLAMSHMMGHIYKSKYIHLRGIKEGPTEIGQVAVDDEDQPVNMHCFTQPFDDLFVWAVITKRHNMALLLWCHGPGALAKSLVAVKLNSYLAKELISTEKTNMAAEFQASAEEWEQLSLELLDSCFRQDAKAARQLLTMELDHWSKQTCLTLAVMANHRMLLGHPCCQILLADLWMGALSLRKHATLKVVLGIICPILIFFWDYKSTEELKLLPHQEKHDLTLVATGGANMGDYRSHRTYDSESLRSKCHGSRCSVNSLYHNTGGKSNLSSYGGKSPYQGDFAMDFGNNIDLHEVSSKLLDLKHHPQAHHHRQARFHEKYHVLDSGATGSFIFDGLETRSSITDQHHPHHHSYRHHHHHHDERHSAPWDDRRPITKNIPESARGPNSSFVTTKHELSAWNKFYEFQKAPVTNFYRHTIAYIVFVCCLAFVILVPQVKDQPGYMEIYVISYVVTHGCDCIREFFSIDAYNCGQKWREFRTNIFILFDFFMVCFFVVGVGLRFLNYFTYGILLYKVSSIYWNLRLYKYMGVHRFVGPKIVMMSRMLKHMAYFAMIILVVLIAFGIARESIRFPDAYPTWKNIAEAFLEPYVMMFGEVDTDALSPQCGEEEQDPCPVGHWIIILTWAIYMLVANILIVNVLIAVFNGIYSEVDAISLELWMFQRFTFVMEFEQKPLLPPPLIVVCHLYGVLRAVIEKCVLCLCDRELTQKGGEFEEGPRVITGNDHSLKTFLSSADANMFVLLFARTDYLQIFSHLSSEKPVGLHLLGPLVFRVHVFSCSKKKTRFFFFEHETHGHERPMVPGDATQPKNLILQIFDFEQDNVDSLNNTNEGLKKLAESQRNRLKDVPLPQERESLKLTGYNQIKNNMRDILRELNDQKDKMDKLLEIWELVNEADDDGGDLNEQNPQSTKPPMKDEQSQEPPVPEISLQQQIKQRTPKPQLPTKQESSKQ